MDTPYIEYLHHNHIKLVSRIAYFMHIQNKQNGPFVKSTDLTVSTFTI